MSGLCALILETSTPQSSLCLVHRDGSRSLRSFHSDRSHNSALFSPLKELMTLTNDLDLVLLGSGPGSYSGTRVGIAAGQGVAIAMHCPAIAIPSLLAVPPVAEGLPCLAVGDARRGTFWSVAITDKGMRTPMLENEREWGLSLARASAQGALLFSLEDPSRWPLPDGVTVRMTQPSAELLWEAWNSAPESTRVSWQSHVPQPLYLQPPHITQARKPISRL